jgi:hypothetical protein
MTSDINVEGGTFAKKYFGILGSGFIEYQLKFFMSIYI